MKYCIKIIYPDGKISYLSHKGKTEFCRRTAKKHADGWQRLHGTLESKTEIEEA